MTLAFDILLCPACGEGEVVADGEHGARCSACSQTYPIIDDLACLYAAPAAALGEWRLRFQREAGNARADAAALRKTVASGGARLAPASRARMVRMADAQASYARELATLLAPFAAHGADQDAELATLVALRTRLPPTQGVMSYAANVFRDWCWGERENTLCYEMLLPQLPARASMRVLVLGCGAGRLTYDLHQQGDAALTVGLDINPLLGRIASELSAGREVTLHEFPLAPKRSADTAISRTLGAPAPARPGLAFALGDVHRPPFVEGSFDVVITPWVVDIVDEELGAQARRINRLLGSDGRWISFGSLSFNGADVATHYSFEEVLEVVAANGFSTPQSVEQSIPYLHSPHSRHARQEEVVMLRMDKVRAARREAPHVALPDWLTEGRTPVPLSESFKLQAASTRIHAFLMSMIDGRRSIEDMAELMESQRLMPRDDAREAIRGFLTRMHDESRQR